MNLSTACFGMPIFEHVFKVAKSKLTVKFDDLNFLFLRYRGNCDTRKWPVKFRDFRETGFWTAPNLTLSELHHFNSL